MQSYEHKEQVDHPQGAPQSSPDGMIALGSQDSNTDISQIINETKAAQAKPL